jgi:hypothetical protein
MERTGGREWNTFSKERILKHFGHPNQPRLRRCGGFASFS